MAPSPNQGVNSSVVAAVVVAYIGVLALLLGGSFLLLLTRENAPAPASVLLGAALACYLGWLVLVMNYLLAWRRDASVRFGARRKRATAVLLPATAVFLALPVLAGQAYRGI